MIHHTHLDATLSLPADAVRAFLCDGVLVLDDFVGAEVCAALRRRALELVAEHAPNAPGTVFSTRDQRHASDAYFEASANRIGVFFEEGAFDDEGRLQVPIEHAVNKLGHAMHDLDPVFAAFARGPALGPKLRAVAEAIGLVDPKLLQSMYIFKPPGIGGEVGFHQDSTYLYTEPESVIGFWFAIDDAHRGNGCLGGLPGEHAKGLREVFRRRPDGRFALEPVIPPPPAWDASLLEWIEVPAGTLVIFNGSFPHLSEANRSSRSRHAYTLHAVSGAALYPDSNWIRRTSGVDPDPAGF